MLESHVTKIISKACTWARINGAKVDALPGQGKVIFFQRLKRLQTAISNQQDRRGQTGRRCAVLLSHPLPTSLIYLHGNCSFYKYY